MHDQESRKCTLSVDTSQEAHLSMPCVESHTVTQVAVAVTKLPVRHCTADGSSVTELRVEPSICTRTVYLKKRPLPYSANQSLSESDEARTEFAHTCKTDISFVSNFDLIHLACICSPTNIRTNLVSEEDCARLEEYAKIRLTFFSLPILQFYRLCLTCQ